MLLSTSYTIDLDNLLGFDEHFYALQGIEVVINSRTGEKITINYRRGRLTSKLPRKLKKRVTRNRCAHLDWSEYCQYQYRSALDRLYQPMVQQIQEHHDNACLQHMLAAAEVARGCGA